MIAYHSSAFGDNARWVGYVQLDTAVTKSMNFSSVSLIQATEYGAAGSFFPARHRAITEYGGLHASENKLGLLRSEMSATILKF